MAWHSYYKQYRSLAKGSQVGRVLVLHYGITVNLHSPQLKLLCVAKNPKQVKHFCT